MTRFWQDWTLEDVRQGARRLGKTWLWMQIAYEFLVGRIDQAGWPTRDSAGEQEC